MQTTNTTHTHTEDFGEGPGGGVALARLIRRSGIDLTPQQLRLIADLLFGTPYPHVEWNPLPLNTPAKVWAPAPGQTPDSVLIDESVVMALMVQAWSDRLDWALPLSRNPKALGEYCTATRVLRSAVRYLLPAEDEVKS